MSLDLVNLTADFFLAKQFTVNEMKLILELYIGLVSRS